MLHLFRHPRSRSQLGRTVLLGAVVGVLSGMAARLMETALRAALPAVIGRVADPGALGLMEIRWPVLLYPLLGGLVSGVALSLLCRPREAHGTALYIEAFHKKGGELPFWDSLVRAVAAVAVIAFGGSVGKEAAIAVLGAGIASGLTGTLRLNRRERRIFLVAGCAGGVGAIFHTPLGGAIFAATVLYRDPDIESDALMPSIISSVISYATFKSFGDSGQFLLRGTGGLAFSRPADLAAYAFLAIVCALSAIGFYACLVAVARVVKRAHLPRWLAPGLAGLGMGAIACLIAQVMDSKYQFVQNVLDGAELGGHSWSYWTALFGLVVVAKCAATAMMVGTDTAGGLFGPVVFIGGGAGAFAGAFLELVAPGAFPEDLRRAMIPVGMAGVLAASLRTPLAAIVMVTEMTGSYGLIVPLMFVSGGAYILGRRHGVYKEQVAEVGDSPAHVGRGVAALLESIKVTNVFDRSWPHVVSPTTTLSAMVETLADGTRPVFAVVEGKSLVGVIPLSQVLDGIEVSSPLHHVIASDLMITNPRAVDEGDDLYATLEVFLEEKAEVLPVVAGDRRYAGMLSRCSILEALREQLSHQHAHLKTEHAGLAELAHEGQLDGLMAALPPGDRRTVERRPVPSDAVGRSLRECDFRRRYGWVVIAVRTSGGDLQAPPDADRRLNADDVLVAIKGAVGERTSPPV